MVRGVKGIMGAYLDRAITELNVRPKDLQEFDEIDPFNDVRLRGFMCRKPDHRYGALYLTHVGDYLAEQLIFCTPKFHYPFDKQGTFHLPESKRIEAYSKIDGTNVFAYKYRGGGKTRVSYKLRLWPFMRNGRWGPFLDYWREMLEKYPDIPDRVLQYSGYGLSFELYGSRNKHLMIYPEELDTKLLFGVDKGGSIQPPSAVRVDLRRDNIVSGSQPVDLLCGYPDVEVVSTLHDLQSLYKKHQAEMDAQIIEVEEQDGFRGPEGRMWYMLTRTGEWRPFKCKPETIEIIHMSAGGLGTNLIRATAYNVLETDDTVTDAAVVLLLREEFTEVEVSACKGLIAKVTASVNQEMEFRRKIHELYRGLSMDIATHKQEVMRALSRELPKNMMQRAYSVLVFGK